MLSQLATGQRAKIGNPAVLSRLQQVAQIADDPTLDQLPRAEAESRLAQVRAVSTAGTITGSSTGNGAPAVQAVLRALASAAEIEDAAHRLERTHPALAEFLRVYGTGRTAQAREHFEAWTRG